MACFSLTYYNDVAPSLTLLTEMQGPDIGGDLIELVISRYPAVASPSDLAAKFSLSSTGFALGTVFLRYSNDQETKLAIKTPAVDLAGSASAFWDVTIMGPVEMKFRYNYVAATPLVLPGSLTPTQGSAAGGVR
eukprot:691749-Hanusia_phi.AAC.1